MLPSHSVYNDYIQKFIGLRTEKEKLNFVNEFIYSANTCQQFINAVDKWVHSDTKLLKDAQRAKLAILISDIEVNVFEGGRDDLNLLLFLEKMAKIITGQ